jgi:hypothetical protein
MTYPRVLSMTMSLNFMSAGSDDVKYLSNA